MPCGGIYPLGKPGGPPRSTGECFACGGKGAGHFCEEWDAYIHARCVPAWLGTPEGAVVIKHEHAVVLDFGLERSHERKADR